LVNYKEKKRNKRHCSPLPSDLSAAAEGGTVSLESVFGAGDFYRKSLNQLKS
jgi:hypothetical protein